jgi:hypothetical protein
MSVSAYEALGPNGSMALLYKDFLPDDDEGNFQRRVLTYFWFDRNVFTCRNSGRVYGYQRVRKHYLH